MPGLPRVRVLKYVTSHLVDIMSGVHSMRVHKYKFVFLLLGDIMLGLLSLRILKYNVVVTFC